MRRYYWPLLPRFLMRVDFLPGIWYVLYTRAESPRGGRDGVCVQRRGDTPRWYCPRQAVELGLGNRDAPLRHALNLL